MNWPVKIKVWKLQDVVCRRKFQEEVRERLQGNCNADWVHFKKSIVGAAIYVCGKLEHVAITKERRGGGVWMFREQ